MKDRDYFETAGKKPREGGGKQSAAQSDNIGEQSEAEGGQTEEGPERLLGGGVASGMAGLHQELVAFWGSAGPSHASHRARRDLQTRLTQAVEEEWAGAECVLHGSSATGLYLSASDLDLVVLGRWEDGVAPLDSLARVLGKLARPGSLSLLHHTRVPLLRLTDNKTGIPVDLSCNNLSGPRAVQLVRIFKRRFPSLPPLLIFLKSFLVARGLSQVFTGGLGSHALTLLIVSFLQLHPRHRPDTANLGVLLMEFLDLYGRRFNYSAVCISVAEGGRYLPLAELDWQDLPTTLALQDPLNPSNNITSGSFRMSEVVRAWAWAYQLLGRAVRRPDSGTTFLQPLITGRNPSFS